ncbi:MinD-like ATPase involved in chromosome partitioning or flagellar assembly [Kribbella sp. VKM Ac-2571]|uniref:AAA family ATPase n=1 Tax=Kribbella sp. VKM Ac-2571 TaxID=2512222 RepID=UPI00105D8952|nr:AAA family ATPase [Kribbella sp. VKM Ac-2571]TDO64052.1 MinD-like ATPase involved in chromosome partitioning or flagellar assembly [Kribbella sp. VKM Ac-2571]
MSDGRIITVFAAKGGCGKTTIATNLAVSLWAFGARRVCLVDLDLQFGDVAIALGMRSQRSLCDAVQWTGSLTVERVAGLMTPFRPGLDCLLAPTGPGNAMQIPHTLIDELLPVLRDAYDYVVVDTPAQFNASVLAALDAADHQVLVATSERPSLKNLRLTLDVLDLLYDASARSVVVNRSDRRADLTAADVDQLVRTPITVQLPNWTDVPASINRGEPITVGYPDHPVSQAVREFADVLVASDGRCSRDPPSA